MPAAAPPVEAAALPATEPQLESVVEPPSGFDPEIAAIFAEEAAEILDNSEAALQEVRQRQDQSAVAMLQRFLHTLKGGARMAGLLPMGDLSHALETLLQRIAEGRGQATPAALDLVQRGLDELQHLRDAIDSGRATAPVSGLVAELEGFEAPVAAEPVPTPAPQGEAPAVVAPSAVVAPPVSRPRLSWTPPSGSRRASWRRGRA